MLTTLFKLLEVSIIHRCLTRSINHYKFRVLQPDFISGHADQYTELVGICTACQTSFVLCLYRLYHISSNNWLCACIRIYIEHEEVTSQGGGGVVYATDVCIMYTWGRECMPCHCISILEDHSSS